MACAETCGPVAKRCRGHRGTSHFEESHEFKDHHGYLLLNFF